MRRLETASPGAGGRAGMAGTSSDPKADGLAGARGEKATSPVPGVWTPQARAVRAGDVAAPAPL